MTAMVPMGQVMKIVHHNPNIMDTKYKLPERKYDRVQRIACKSLYNSNQEINYNPMSFLNVFVVIRIGQITEHLVGEGFATKQKKKS